MLFRSKKMLQFQNCAFLGTTRCSCPLSVLSLGVSRRLLQAFCLSKHSEKAWVGVLFALSVSLFFSVFLTSCRSVVLFLFFLRSAPDHPVNGPGLFPLVLPVIDESSSSNCIDGQFKTSGLYQVSAMGNQIRIRQSRFNEHRGRTEDERRQRHYSNLLYSIRFYSGSISFSLCSLSCICPLASFVLSFRFRVYYLVSLHRALARETY